MKEKVERYRRAMGAYCEAETEPDLLDLAKYFNLHPAGVIRAASEQQWIQKRATYRAMKASGYLTERAATAQRIDASAVKSAERIIRSASEEYERLAAAVIALPSEPAEEDKAGKTPEAIAMLRARLLRRKADLLSDIQGGFMDMVTKASDIGLVAQAEGKGKNARAGGEPLLDFTKLTHLNLTLVQGTPSVKAAEPVVDDDVVQE